MTIPRRQMKSMEAYLTLMQGKGADKDNLSHRRKCLETLLPFLANKPVRGEFYRNAVDESLAKVDRSEWPFYLAVAREYFHFWANDFKAIAAMHAKGGFDMAPSVPAPPTRTFKQLWDGLEAEKFSVSEMWPLKAYVAALRQQGADSSVVETRQKLSKLLLVQLREVEDRNGAIYRAVVDSLLPIFTMKEMSLLFILVVREFFYFWMGDPDAPSHILLDSSSSGEPQA